MYEIHLLEDFSFVDPYSCKQRTSKAGLIASHAEKNTTLKHLAKIQKQFPDAKYVIKETPSLSQERPEKEQQLELSL